VGKEFAGIFFVGLVLLFIAGLAGSGAVGLLGCVILFCSTGASIFSGH